MAIVLSGGSVYWLLIGTVSVHKIVEAIAFGIAFSKANWNDCIAYILMFI